MGKDVNISNQPKKGKSKKLLILITIIVILVATIICLILMYPSKCITSINDNYNSQQYDKVAKYDSKLNMLKNYLKEKETEYNKIQYKVKLAKSLILIENSEYESALQQLLEIKETDEIVTNKINDCKYELGKKYLEEKQYDNALEFFQAVTNKEDINTLLDTTYSELALKCLEEKNYIQALEEIRKVTDKNNENYNNLKKQIHYEYGKYNLSRNDYNGGISQLEQAKDYEDANTLVNNAYIEKAEKYIKDGNLQEAKNIYNYLPEEIEHNGIKVSDRKNQLNKFASLIDITGKKYATKTYCESRNIWRYDGRWTNWHIDASDASEYIDTRLILNDDGTVTLKGTAYFYAFNNFSSLAEYCKANIVSRTIEIKNIHSIPSTYDIDENTKLLYSKGKFTIKYSKRDDYSTSFYNMYLSTVTY